MECGSGELLFPILFTRCLSVSRASAFYNSQHRAHGCWHWVSLSDAVQHRARTETGERTELPHHRIPGGARSASLSDAKYERTLARDAWSNRTAESQLCKYRSIRVIRNV